MTSLPMEEPGTAQIIFMSWLTSEIIWNTFYSTYENKQLKRPIRAQVWTKRLTWPSSSLRSEVLTRAPSWISGSKKSLSQVIKKEPRNFCISTVTYMDTGIIKLKRTMKERKSVNIFKYWNKDRTPAFSLLKDTISWLEQQRLSINLISNYDLLNLICVRAGHSHQRPD